MKNLTRYLVSAFVALLPAVMLAGEYGAGFMKLGIGARQLGMGRTFAGVGDDLFTVFWNPGGMGFQRRWQWAAGYDQWLADTYQASFLYAQQIRFLGSPKFTIGVGGVYFGMPDFDSSQGASVASSASSFVGMLAFGQRLDWLTWPADIGKHLALGASVKFIKSRLDQFSAFGAVADFGFVFKPPRIKLGSAGLGVFDFGVLTLGGTYQNLNLRGLTYDRAVTSIPSLLKFGGALNLGRHDGWNLLLAFDSGKYSDEDRTNSLGAEVWWRQFLGARVGYELNSQNIGGFSLGAGMRLGIAPITNLLFGLDDNELRCDFANSDNGEIFESTYRGSVTHYPNGPEPFGMIRPANLQDFDKPTVEMHWEAAEDPDPFDEVRYVLLVDTDGEKLEQARKEIEKDYNQFLASNWGEKLKLVYETNSVLVDTLMSGRDLDYYWTVAAIDRDGHVRVAHGSKDKQRKFTIKRPDLVVQDIRLRPIKWITSRTDGQQGTLEVVVKNIGNGYSQICTVSLVGLQVPDEIVNNIGIDSLLNSAEISRQDLVRFDSQPLSALKPGETRTVQFDWNTLYQGAVRFLAKVDVVSEINDERVEDNNFKYAAIYTIPKWDADEIKIAARDTFNVIAARYNNLEVPLVPIVFFEVGSDVVQQKYRQPGEVPGALRVIAERVKQHPRATLSIRGFMDPLSESRQQGLEPARATAVRDQLIALGVNENRLTIIEGGKATRRHFSREVDKSDALRIGEENRRVELYVQKEFEAEIFRPIDLLVRRRLVEREREASRPEFLANIISPAGVKNWSLKIIDDKIDLASITDRGLIKNDTIKGTIHWNGLDAKESLVNFDDRRWRCRVVVVDGQNREFETQPQPFSIREVKTIFREHIFALFEFAEAIPTFEFYRQRLEAFADSLAQYDQFVRIGFEGHTCEIGSQDYNDKLSMKRAREFTDGFHEILRKRSQEMPERFNYFDLFRRVDPPYGCGETRPLILNIPDKGERLLGDNRDPVGRNLDRRVMIYFYRVPEPKFTTK
jgi:outer membrane protein OmpA-like peptidoglycan-associated protein